MQGKETYLIIVLLLAGFGALLFLEFSEDRNSAGSPLAESHKQVANELFNKALYEQAVAEYDKYIELAGLAPEKAANIQYMVGKIEQDQRKDYSAALARYIMAKNLAPKASFLTEVNTRMVECLEHLERSTDAQALLREATLMNKPTGVPTPRPGDPIAKIGDRIYTMGDLDAAMAKLPPQIKSQFTTPQKKLEFFQGFLSREVLAQAARRKGLQKDEEVLRQLEEMREDLMVQRLIEQEVKEKAKPSDSEIELYYKANPSKYMSTETKDVAHIQLDSEDAARELRKSILSGETSFEDAAKQQSKDSATSAQGGLIGTMSFGGTLPGMSDAPKVAQTANDLKVGAISFPVETSRGFHLVKVLQENPAQPLPLEQVREQVIQDYTAENAQKVQQDLFQRYMKAEDVKIYEDVLQRQLGVSGLAGAGGAPPSGPGGNNE